MKISRANKIDLPELVQVWEASVRATHDFVMEDDIVSFRSLVPQYLAAVDLYVIRGENKILGFLGTGELDVQMLFILPDYRGKGLGKVFMQFAIKERGVTKVEVNEQNRQAIGFYEHMGFKVVGRAELDHTGRPYPLLFMELDRKDGLPQSGIKIKRIDSIATLGQCAELLVSLYNQAPWNDHWTRESALALLNCYYQTPEFTGWVAVSGHFIVGCALGNIEPHYSGKIFYLREMFISPPVQNTGLGKLLMASLQRDLEVSGTKTVILFTRTAIFDYYRKFGFVEMEEMGMMHYSAG